MTERADGANFLREIQIVTASKSWRLGGPPVVPAASDAPARPMSLASEAMRWSYVLRSRERWRDSAEVMARHQRDASATLHAFGVTDGALQAMAQAGRVVVTMPFQSEGRGWEGRIFPWEFVISRATRRWRNAQTPMLTVMRRLQPAQPPAKPVLDSARRLPVSGRVLFVRSFPGALAQAYAADEESLRVRNAFGLAADDERWRVLVTPTLADLQAACKTFKPSVVHLAGCDNHQGLQLLRDYSGPEARVVRGGQAMTAGDLLRDEDGVNDGYLLRDADGLPSMVSPSQLGAALTGGRSHQPLFVGINVWNSAARIAPLLLPEGVFASMGFQDAFDDALAEYFFETLYRTLAARQWNVPLAFEEAWAATRRQVDLVPGTGITLWAREALIEPRTTTRSAVTPDAVALAKPAAPVQARIEPKREINYAELHNQGDWSDAHDSALFDRFELHGAVTEPPAKVQVTVELNCGPESARYEAEVLLDQERRSLLGDIKLPLTATLMRSVSEAMVSTVLVHVQSAGQTVHRNTYAIRLLPVDQWRDNRISGQWLPSFVLPRDPAVERAVTAAQRYVRVIRDDPSAGFEGYQSANSNDPESLDNVDLQVEAIWASLLHEWQLGYINPPPTYNRALDSQRLRTPSSVYGTRMGTCIDLALVFAACLELVDIQPVLFLLDGHALPGYWRHSDFRAAFQTMSATPAVASSDQNRSAAPGEQRRPWHVDNHAEVRKLIRDGCLAPIETVRLTEHCGFREARAAGVQALQNPADFDSIIDIAIAREHQVTPLPIVGGGRE